MKLRAWFNENRLITVVSILFFSSICIFYPGFFSEDSISQLAEARSGIYSDTHPPIMAYIWRHLDGILPGQFGMLALQLFLYWSGLYLIAKYSNIKESKRTNFLLFAGLFPGTLGILGAIWKDVLLMAFGVFGIGMGFRAIRLRSKWNLIFSIGTLFLACSLRQNGIFILPPLLVGITYVFSSQKWRVTWAATIVGLFLFQAGNHLITYHFLQAKKTHLWRLLPLFDIGGTYFHLGSLPDKELIPFSTDSFKIETLNAQYTPRSLMPLVLPLCYPEPTSCQPLPFFDINLKPDLEGEQQLQKLKSVWFQTVINYPIQYLIHRFKAFSHLLGIHGELWAPVYFTSVKNDLGLVAEPSVFQKEFSQILRKLTKFGFFNAWLFLLINLYVIFKIVSNIRSLDKPFLLGIACSSLLFESAYFIITPSMDYRYSYWFIVGTIIVALVYRFHDDKVVKK